MKKTKTAIKLVSGRLLFTDMTPEAVIDSKRGTFHMVNGYSEYDGIQFVVEMEYEETIAISMYQIESITRVEVK